METTHKKRGIYERWFKRLLDFLCALSALIFFSWLYAIIAILVRVKLGYPVIFAQERPGMIDPLNGEERIFKLYKFRTMTDARDEHNCLLPDSVRLTKFGRLLRATSLDELPEVINILKGDMSIIGPRPLAVSYLKYYTEAERRRHCVRPGLSGWAQVNGRNSLTWEQKFEYDMEYIDHLSFLFDVKIVWLTIKKVLKKEGIGQGECAPVSLSVERAEQCIGKD